MRGSAIIPGGPAGLGYVGGRIWILSEKTRERFQFVVPHNLYLTMFSPSSVLDILLSTTHTDHRATQTYPLLASRHRTTYTRLTGERHAV